MARTAASGSAPHPELVSQLLGTQRHARGLAELTPRQRDVLTLMAEGPFFVLEVGSRYVHNLGVTANPDRPWTFQQATNLLTALGDRADPFKVLIRDRAGQFTAAFDAGLADAGVTVYKSPPRSPASETPTPKARRHRPSEVTDRMLILGERHRRRVLGEYAVTTTGDGHTEPCSCGPYALTVPPSI